jgi:hypothetical protein
MSVVAQPSGNRVKSIRKRVTRLGNPLRKRGVKWIESPKEQVRKQLKVLMMSERATLRETSKDKVISLRWYRAIKRVGIAANFRFSFRKRVWLDDEYLIIYNIIYKECLRNRSPHPFRLQSQLVTRTRSRFRPC